MKSPAIIWIRRRLPANCRNSSPRGSSVLLSGRPFRRPALPSRTRPIENAVAQSELAVNEHPRIGAGPGVHSPDAGAARLLSVRRLPDAPRRLVELHEMERAHA